MKALDDFDFITHNRFRSQGAVQSRTSPTHSHKSATCGRRRRKVSCSMKNEALSRTRRRGEEIPMRVESGVYVVDVYLMDLVLGLQAWKYRVTGEFC